MELSVRIFNFVWSKPERYEAVIIGEKSCLCPGFKLANELPLEDKIRLGEELRAEIRKARTDHIFKIFKNDELTDGEITAEVEYVRQQMYEERMRMKYEGDNRYQSVN